MKPLTLFTLIAFTALSLSACGGPGAVDHSQMDHTETKGDTGQTTGTVVSISPDGTEATIAHQKIDGVGMGAMTMGFGIVSTVDLSKFSKDDAVRFRVKKGRDDRYRITEICNTDTDGKDCLN